MRGLELRGHSLRLILEPIRHEVSAHYWLFDREGVRPEARDALVDAEFGLWGPGALTDICLLPSAGEWEYVVGLPGPEPRAIEHARALLELEWPAGLLEQQRPWTWALLAIQLEPDEWQIYSPEGAWLRRIAAALPAKPVDSSVQEWND